ncbi:hypothetical protein AB0D10_05555 [Kitasatospora sp. NPDC048545]|uniref:hypothetical protein n=1 Tax=Kitasatospora sp. NPDC048545 TaxID=3157208 RepID=UPI0033E06D38
MTLTEHCPSCLSAARIVHRVDDGTHICTEWLCGRCGRSWRTEYLSDAYADEESYGTS